jgi:hypothetical protein
VQVTVKNTGRVAGDEVVFMYHNASNATQDHHSRSSKSVDSSVESSVDSSVDSSAESSVDSPPIDPTAIKQLVAYQRVTLAAGASTVVTFNVRATMLSTVDRFGTRHVLGGEHELIFSRGHGPELRRAVTVVVDEATAANNRVLVSTLAGWATNTGT